MFPGSLVTTFKADWGYYEDAEQYKEKAQSNVVLLFFFAQSNRKGVKFSAHGVRNFCACAGSFFTTTTEGNKIWFLRCF